MGFYEDTIEFERSHVFESEWSDKTQPPGIDLVEAHQIGRSVCDFLDGEHELTGSKDWEVRGLDFERLTSKPHGWAYIVALEASLDPEPLTERESRFITFVLLLDGTIMFDSRNYSPELAKVFSGYPRVIDCTPTDPNVNVRDYLKSD